MQKLTSRQQAHDTVKTAVTRFMEGEDFLRWLAFRRSFHSYSFHNTVLIWLQCPHASQVAGFKTWLKHDRRVRKGEKGIQILAPRIVKDEETGEKDVRGFFPVYVFDVSQTDGAPLPALPTEALPRMSDPAITAALHSFADQRGVTIVQDDQRLDERGALGIYRHDTKEIAVRSALFEAEYQLTLVHELAHHLWRETPKAQKLDHALEEAMVESTALMVMTALGFDIDPASLSYIARYAQDPQLAVAVLDVATELSKPIIDHLVSAQQKEEAAA